MEWKMQNIDKAEYVGVIEGQDKTGEYHIFEIVNNGIALVFGTTCNTGLLQSGYMNIDKDFSLNENIQELYFELDVLIKDGIDYCSNIVCNDRI